MKSIIKHKRILTIASLALLTSVSLGANATFKSSNFGNSGFYKAKPISQGKQFKSFNFKSSKPSKFKYSITKASAGPGRSGFGKQGPGFGGQKSISIRGNKAQVFRVSSNKFENKRDLLIGDKFQFDASLFSDASKYSVSGTKSGNGSKIVFKDSFINDSMQKVRLISKVLLRPKGVFEAFIKQTRISRNVTLTEKTVSNGNTSYQQLIEEKRVSKNKTLTKTVTFRDNKIVKTLELTKVVQTRFGKKTITKLLDKIIIRRRPPVST